MSIAVEGDMASGYEPPPMSLNPPATSRTLDELFRLVGDEDCGVGINCRICDRGGAPIAYYAGLDQPYPTELASDVVPVDTIAALISAAEKHAAVHT